jgi:phage FluMu protein Com
MKANIRRSNSNVIRAECSKCGRFLAEVHGTTHVITKCPKCGVDNTIIVLYSEPSGFAVRSRKETRKSIEKNQDE